MLSDVGGGLVGWVDVEGELFAAGFEPCSNLLLAVILSTS